MREGRSPLSKNSFPLYKNGEGDKGGEVDKQPPPTSLNLTPKSGKIVSVEAGVAELADAADLKSAGVILVGSSPTPGTN